MKRILFISALILGASLIAHSQTGVLKGKVTDRKTNEPIPFAQVVVQLDKKVVNGATTDMDGFYIIKPLDTAKYDIEVTFLGYGKIKIKGVQINSNKQRILNIEMESSVNELQVVTIMCYKAPLIDYDQCSSGGTITSRQINKMPGRSAYNSSVTVGGTFSNQNGTTGGIRGSRSCGTATYIDGVQVIGSSAEANTESYGSIVENEFQSVYQEPLSTFSVDVDKASYSNVRRFLDNDQMPPADAVRIEEMINYFHYSYPTPQDDKPFSIYLEAAKCPWNPEHQLIQIGLKAKELDLDELPPSNFVYLLDVSGSMGYSNKLPLLKKSLMIMIDKLRPEDKVAIVVYAGAAGCVLKSTSGADKSTIKRALKKLESGGSTAGGAGIELAYKIAKQNFIKGGNNRVIMATDGDFNVGVSSNTSLVKLIEKKREEGVFLTILGFGMGNYKDDKMEELSNAGNGNYAYIDNILEAEKTLGTEMYGTLYTIAKDVKIQIEFNPAEVKAYRLIGYENRMLAAKDFNDDKKDAGEVGMGHYVTALYEVIPTASKENIDRIDSLRYQSQNLIVSDELLTVKFRYKEPDGKKSTLISKSISTKDITKDAKSDNLLLASSVAEFGLLLRQSKYMGQANYNDVIKRVRKTLKNDENGYRAELMKMMKTARLLSSN